MRARLASSPLVLAAFFVSFSAGAQPEPPAPAPGGEVTEAAAPADTPKAASPPSPVTPPAVAPPPTATAGAPVAPAALELPPGPPHTPPVGHAAPPTEAATSGAGPIRAGLEVFAEYRFRDTDGPGANRTWFHVFDLPRAHAAVEGEWKEVRGRVLVEATRSATEGALIGVAGDSLVLRVREAYAAYRPWSPLELAGGVLPTLTVPNLDGTWMLRPVAPSVLEANGLLAAADLGARARATLPAGYGWVGVVVTNGEGYTSRELNRGKNVETAAELHPLPRGPLLPLGVFASYSAGSSGTTLARADRATGGLVWQGDRVRAGAFVTHARGVAQLGRQKALAATAFVRVEPIERLLLGARVDHVVRDTETDPEDAVTTLWGSVGWRLAGPLEAFLALSRSIPTTRAQAEVPGSNAWELRAIGRVIF